MYVNIYLNNPLKNSLTALPIGSNINEEPIHIKITTPTIIPHNTGLIEFTPFYIIIY
jgi:hypothetical protein